MRKAIEQIYAQMGEATRVLLVLSIILFAGFLVTRLTKITFPRCERVYSCGYPDWPMLPLPCAGTDACADGLYQ